MLDQIGLVLGRDVGTSPPADIEVAGEAPARASAELDECACQPVSGIAAVTNEEIVDIEHGPLLQQRLDEVEHRDGGLIEIAVDGCERDLASTACKLALQLGRERIAIE